MGTYTLRVPPDLDERIRALAKHQFNSVAGTILWIVNQWLEDRESESLAEGLKTGQLSTEDIEASGEKPTPPEERIDKTKPATILRDEEPIRKPRHRKKKQA